MTRRLWSIGEFAKRSGLTARALRLYDESGLLPPASVDSWTGYRQYSPGQLETAELVAALRRAGVPLDVVREVVAADAATAHKVVERWWDGVVSSHERTAALVGLLHRRIDGEDVTMPATPDAFEAALQATQRGEVDALRAALDADPTLAAAADPDGRTLLALAVRMATADHAIPSRDGGPAYHDAVRALLDAGADPSAPDAEGWTPLHSAGISGHEAMAGTLLAAGADRAAALGGVPGATPLSFALFYAHAGAAEVIAGDAPVPDDLRSAAALGRTGRMHELLDAGFPLPASAGEGMDFCGPPAWFPPRAAEPTDQTILDESLCWASRNGRIDAMQVLVDAGADVNANPYRGTPLLWAVYRDCVPAAAWLLDRGADPDLRHDFGGAQHGKDATAMHLAAQYGCMGCLRLLLDRGADHTVRDGSWESTPLGWARHDGHADEAVALLEALE